MTEYEKYKNALNEMGIKTSYIIGKIGYRKQSYYSAFSRLDDELPDFAKPILWVYENCGKNKARKYIEDL